MERDFARRRLAPHSAEWNRNAMVPCDARRELGKLGFMGMTVPAQWDGAGDGAVSPIMRGHNSVGRIPLETAESICSDAIQTPGDAGCITDYGVDRTYRAVPVAKIYEGTNDIQRLVISRALVAEARRDRGVRSCSA